MNTQKISKKITNEIPFGKEETDKKGNAVSFLIRTEQVTEEDEKGDDRTFLLISEIKRTKIIKKGTMGMKERSEIKKFGLCSGQLRGTIESGVVRIDNEIKITNRNKQVYHEGLKEKLRSTGFMKSKEDLIRKMNEENEKKANKQSETKNELDSKKKMRQSKETDVKITGFNMTFDEHDLMKLFTKVGEVKKCIILKDRITGAKRNIAFLEFRQTYSVQKAIDRFDNRTVSGCVMIVSRPSDEVF